MLSFARGLYFVARVFWLINPREYNLTSPHSHKNIKRHAAHAHTNVSWPTPTQWQWVILPIWCGIVMEFSAICMRHILALSYLSNCYDTWLLELWFEYYYVLPTYNHFIVPRLVATTEFIRWYGYIFESVKMFICGNLLLMNCVYAFVLNPQTIMYVVLMLWFSADVLRDNLHCERRAISQLMI